MSRRDPANLQRLIDEREDADHEPDDDAADRAEEQALDEGRPV